MTSITLTIEDVRKIFHITYKGSLKSKIENYFNFFKKVRPDINFMKRNNLLSKYLYIKEIKNSNNDYNEEVGFSVYEPACGDDLYIDFYFRSLRTKFAVIENVSGKNMKNIIFHVEAYEPSNILQLNLEEYDKSNHKMVSKEIPFPIDILKKDESIVFPLEMMMVTPEYASGYIYESDGDDVVKLLKKGGVVDSGDGNIYKAILNEKKRVIMPVKEKGALFSEKEKFFYGKTLYNQSIGIGSNYKIKYISFRVDGDNEKKTYRRDFSPENLIYVNDTCECGSCPLLFAENQQGQWRRLREIISEYRDKNNEGRFEYLLPLSAKSIKIKEVDGETSYFRDMAVLVKTKNNNETAHYMDNYITVTSDTSLLIDLSDIKIKYTANEIVSIKLAGYGYYQSKSKEICPRVLNLSYDYF